MEVRPNLWLLSSEQAPPIPFTPEGLYAGAWLVRHGLHRVGGRLQVLPAKIPRSRRTIPLPALVVRELKAHP